MVALNHSKSRDAILRFLMTRRDHPTAEIIYNNVRQECPKISLGTVYRNLTLLSDIGEIQKISCGDVSEHFDGNAHPHPHFVCNKCYRVDDLEMDNLDFLNTLANQNFSGAIEKHQLIFYGKCEKCKEEI